MVKCIIGLQEVQNQFSLEVLDGFKLIFPVPHEVAVPNRDEVSELNDCVTERFRDWNETPQEEII